MILAYSARKTRDVVTKPTKVKQINQSSTGQFLPEKKSVAYKVPPSDPLIKRKKTYEAETKPTILEQTPAEPKN